LVYGFLGSIISILLKEYKKEYALYASLITGGIILTLSLGVLNDVILFIQSFSNRIGDYSGFVYLLLKITGVSILIEFAVSICKDSGESAIASKIDFGGKMIILGMSLPIISELFNVLTNIMNG